jgi:hypothetical protein
MLLALTVCPAFAEDAQATDALYAAKARWAAANLSTYSFVVSYSCFCFGLDIRTPARITVRNDKIQHARYISSVPGHAFGRVSRVSPLRVTVTDLFSMIEDSLKNDSELIIAKYDDVLGFPLRLAIDSSPGMSDSDFAYDVAGFRR